MSKQMILKVFDLFSGGGGFRQGAEKAGMEIIAHCEIDKWAEKFYTQAFDTKKELYFNDATKIDTRELPDFDVLLAGFPCQAFSIAGKRQGFKDTRGTMFFEVVRILNDKRPRYFILENVKGLLSHDNGKTFQTILRVLSDIGVYSIEWGVLNSKYFGVPQNRERVFIVGYPRRYGIGKVFPIGETKEIYHQTGANQKEVHNIASTLKARDYASWGGNFVKVGTLRTHKDGQGFREIKDGASPCVPARAREDDSGRLVIYQFARGNNKGDIYEECPTITRTTSWSYNNILIDDYNGAVCDIVPTVRESFKNPANRNGCKLFQNGTFRRLTPLECFRLQSFSDEVVKKGRVGISDAQLYKIAGNSVTVNVVYEIAKKIVEIEEK